MILINYGKMIYYIYHKNQIKTKNNKNI